MTRRRTRGRVRGTPLERIWPRAAGAALAVGAADAIHHHGLARTVVIATVTGLLSALVWFAMKHDGPPSLMAVALLIAQAAGCAVTCWGLIDLGGWWGVPPLVLLGLGSPLARSWVVVVHDRVALSRMERGIERSAG